MTDPITTHPTEVSARSISRATGQRKITRRRGRTRGGMFADRVDDASSSRPDLPDWTQVEVRLLGMVVRLLGEDGDKPTPGS